jgi:3-methyladenine DNA glycosylase AlkD
MDYKEIIGKLESLKNPGNVIGMARFGIRPKTKVYGVPIPELRKIAKTIGKEHKLALELWDSKIHEARILAGMIADSEKMTASQIEKWVSGFDSWDVCDQVCMNLFSKSEIAKNQILKFSKSKEEFVKRTAFALMAALSVHDKKMQDKDFIKFFSLIKKASSDERNFVKKAVNWSLRQIGKRNKKLNAEAIKVAREILQLSQKVYSHTKFSAEIYGVGARWIATGAIKELTSEKIQKKLSEKKKI